MGQAPPQTPPSQWLRQTNFSNPPTPFGLATYATGQWSIDMRSLQLWYIAAIIPASIYGNHTSIGQLGFQHTSRMKLLNRIIHLIRNLHVTRFSSCANHRLATTIIIVSGANWVFWCWKVQNSFRYNGYLIIYLIAVFLLPYLYFRFQPCEVNK